MELPKSAKECAEILKDYQQDQEHICHEQVEMAKEYVQLVKLDGKILTAEHLKTLTALVSVGGKEILSILVSIIKENPSKEVAERAAKVGFYCVLYDLAMKWFHKELDKNGSF